MSDGEWPCCGGIFNLVYMNFVGPMETHCKSCMHGIPENLSRRVQTPEHATPNTSSAKVRTLQMWLSNVYDRQCNGPIPKLTQFSYFQRDGRSGCPIMGWGLFALQPAKEGEKLLPFVGPQYTLAEYRILS